MSAHGQHPKLFSIENDFTPAAFLFLNPISDIIKSHVDPTTIIYCDN